MLKNLLYSLLYFFICFVVGNIIVTIFSYFNILNNNIINILDFVYPLMIIALNSYLLGNKASKKGFLEGLKFGGIIVCVFFIITILTNNFNFKVLIYYLVILLVSVMSSTIGINIKEKNA